ncbi:MAG: gluconate 2-dehydrogenase subunit 3 family protein [Flavobacteriaceae bacterium]|nr:MAG: gluconate 2-dehydrogenase subunit 3 family protein [Flavobacteriaceae bacterium]
MDRREALQLTAALLGTSVFGASAFLSGCSSPGRTPGALTDEELPLLNALCEAILPATSKSPGAGAAKVGKFVLAIVNDCYSDKEAQVFESGIRSLQRKVKEVYGKEFLKLNSEDQSKLLTEYDKEAQEYEDKDAPHFYSMLLQLTLWGFFISEPGATQALRYNPIPGRYEGCIPYEKGQSAWAS